MPDVPWDLHRSVARIGRSQVACMAKTMAGKPCYMKAIYHIETPARAADYCHRHILSEYVNSFDGASIKAWAKKMEERMGRVKS